MNLHNGMKFSTFDRDQDMWPKNCASTFREVSGTTNVTVQTLMGVYRWGLEKSLFAVGVSWYTWKGTYEYSVKSHRHEGPSCAAGVTFQEQQQTTC